MTKKERFNNAGNYALYYGHNEAWKLSKFNFVIVEPDGQNEETIKTIKSNGTLVLAYISIMEIAPFSPVFNTLEREDFIIKDGKPIKNNNFGTYFINLSSLKWNRILMERIECLLTKMDYDGIFLDTIGNVESNEIPLIYRDSMYKNAIKIISTIRDRYSDTLIIQNNGLNFLIKDTACFIDAICWENPDMDNKASKFWTRNTLEMLTEISKRYNLKILLLFEQNDKKESGKSIKSGKKLAKSNGFLLYTAPPQYSSGVNLP